MHDASCALVVDGHVINAAEEERFTRIKHAHGLPINAIRFCLDNSGLKISEIDAVCASWRPWVLRRRAIEAFKSFYKSSYMFKAKLERGMGQMYNEWAELFRLRQLLNKYFGEGKYTIHYVDHHLSHAASAFLCSPYDRSAILTVDGAGEAETTVFWLGEGKSIKKLKAIKLPHSLGQFYSAVTAFLGFNVQADEYKVMGLAALGKPLYAEHLKRHFIRFHTDGTFYLDPYFIDYHLARKGLFLKPTVDVFGKQRQREEEITQRHADVAASAQAIIEEAFFHMVNHLYRLTMVDNLCLAGGVAFNCVAAGKLLAHTPFRKIFLQPAAGDAGGAIGAPLYIEHSKNTPNNREYIFKSVYLGPSYTTIQCEKILNEMNIPYERYTESELLKKTAEIISNGKLLFWFHGRMEWGPRALGARSLLADPRIAEMKDIINKRVKHREHFRPFAPSILAEKASEFFDYYYNSPFMNFAFPVRHDIAAKIPATIHIDNTARPQAVFKDINPRFWALIKEFEKITNIPLLLNTSFNVQEPIVCTPKEAITTFLNTKVDYLVLEDFIVKQKE